jgi:hypothetical protein
MATRVTWQGSPYNGEIIKDIYLVESGGAEFGLRGSIIGDIAIVSPQSALVPVYVNGKAISAVAGQDSAGSITLPLIARYLKDVAGTGVPSLYEILSQTGLGRAYVPYQVVPGTDPDGDVFAFATSPRGKMWKLVIELQPHRSGAPTAVLGTRITVYAMVGTSDIQVANVGGQSAFTINGAVYREGMISVTTY